jgi:4-hydroxy-3-methylbut-2-en-1-yl diphosphate reductase
MPKPPLTILMTAPRGFCAGAVRAIDMVEAGLKDGCRRAALVQNAQEIDRSTLANVTVLGVTAGASAPEILIEKIIDTFRRRYEVMVENVTWREENVSFKLPRLLREAEPAR